MWPAIIGFMPKADMTAQEICLPISLRCGQRTLQCRRSENRGSLKCMSRGQIRRPDRSWRSRSRNIRRSKVALRPGVSAAGVLCPGPHKINRSPPNAARRGQACWSVPMRSREGGRNYFSELLIEVNLSLRFVPRPLTTAIMASAMPAAIRPYSIAVAPDSSDKKFNKVRFNSAS